MASDLIVNLSANTSKFNKGLADASSGARSFTGTIVSLLNPINFSLDAIAAKAAAVGLSFYGIAERIQTLAGVADKAAQTGLSGLFIQRLGYAADQSGISADTLTGAFEKMTITLGKAELQSEDTQKALDQIGLTSEKLQSMKPDDQFLAIADAIGKLPTVAQRAAASTALFGKSAMELGSLFADGKKGISELMAEAEKLNIGVSDEDLKSIATADDAIERMKTTFSDLLSKVTVELAPVFETMSNNLTAILPKLTEVAKGIASGVGDSLKFVADLITTNVIPPVKEFLTTTADLVTKWSNMQDKWKFLGDVIAAGFKLGVEHIKVYWSEMLDQLLAWTADKAKSMLAMLNPITAVGALSDYATGTSSEYSGVRSSTGESKLTEAQRNFENLMRQLNGEAPLTATAIASKEIPKPMSADERKLMGAIGKPSESNAAKQASDANVKATETQTNKLVDALRNYGQPKLNLVTEFGP